MRVAFFMRLETADVKKERVRPQVSELSDEIVEGLRGAGHEVEEIVPEARAWDLLHLEPEHDLYVLKSKNPLDLDLAEALERAGARVVNAAQASRLVKNKIAHTPFLARAGVPQPDAWTVASKAALVALLERLEREGAECLVKPPSGSMAEGIYTLSGPDDLQTKENEELVEGFVDSYGQPAPLLVQRKVPNNGMDLKVYVVGEWVAAIERPFPAKTEEEKRGTPAEVTPAVREAALTCGRALGLELYGVDFLFDPENRERFWVVDVNAFPSYRGIEGAAERVVAHLEHHLEHLPGVTGETGRRRAAPARSRNP